jgi:ribosomal protein S18 acetylase RimI-like enzyme
MVAIRSARLADVAGILELWSEADVVPSHTDDVAGLERLIRHDPGATLVAESGDRIIGSVIAAWDGWRGSVYRLAVAPGNRRSGLGRQLVTEAERKLKALGARRLQAVVVESDPGATGFWRATGWIEQVERVRFVKG